MAGVIIVVAFATGAFEMIDVTIAVVVGFAVLNGAWGCPSDSTVTGAAVTGTAEDLATEAIEAIEAIETGIVMADLGVVIGIAVLIGT